MRMDSSRMGLESSVRDLGELSWLLYSVRIPWEAAIYARKQLPSRHQICLNP